jgi:5-formyltetrahydrofolate cyclo-ligase
MSDALIVAKRLARVAAQAARAAAASEAAGAALATNLLSLPLPAGAIVSGFWPMGDEIDIRPAMTALAEHGHTLALPVTGRRGTPLVFRAWMPGEPLKAEPFGTMAPESTAPIVRPAVLLVPLLAFDRGGWRLGYGGGYYDRTLTALRAELPVLAIGVGFAAQEIPVVPRGDTDARLDAVVTERGAFVIAAGS